MRSGETANLHEIYCHACRVSFPTGTRRCMHCGQRLGRQRFQEDVTIPPPLDEDVIQELKGRRGFSPVTALWVTVAVVAAVVRACTGGE